MIYNKNDEHFEVVQPVFTAHRHRDVLMMREKMKASILLGFMLTGYFYLTPVVLGDDRKPVVTGPRDKCPVCGMFVSKYPNWIAQILFTDGTYAVFDGPKDMFKFYLDPGKYLPQKKTDIARVFVTEYYSVKLTDATSLFFVQGSDVYGPMGTELIPLGSREHAREFMKDHKGKKILTFDEIKPGDLN